MTSEEYRERALEILWAFRACWLDFELKTLLDASYDIFLEKEPAEAWELLKAYHPRDAVWFAEKMYPEAIRQSLWLVAGRMFAWEKARCPGIGDRTLISLFSTEHSEVGCGIDLNSAAIFARLFALNYSALPSRRALLAEAFYLQSRGAPGDLFERSLLSTISELGLDGDIIDEWKRLIENKTNEPAGDTSVD